MQRKFRRNPISIQYDPAELIRNQFRNSDQYLNEWCLCYDYFHTNSSIYNIAYKLGMYDETQLHNQITLNNLQLSIPNPENTTYVLSHQLIEDLLQIPMTQYQANFFKEHLPVVGQAKIFQYSRPLKFPELENLKVRLSGYTPRELEEFYLQGQRVLFKDINFLGMMISRTSKKLLLENLLKLPYPNSTVREPFRIHQKFNPQQIQKQLQLLQTALQKEGRDQEEDYYIITQFITNNKHFGLSEVNCPRYQQIIKQVDVDPLAAYSNLMVPPVVYFPPGQVSVFSFYITESTWEAALHGQPAEIDEEILGNARFAIRLLSLFSYANLVSEVVRPEKKSIEGRSKKERIQRTRQNQEIEAGIFDHYLIGIRVGPKVVHTKKEAVGTHASPRGHERQAHNKLYYYCGGLLKDEACETIIPASLRDQPCPNCGSLVRLQRLRYCPRTLVMGGRSQTIPRDYYVYTTHRRSSPEEED